MLVRRWSLERVTGAISCLAAAVWTVDVMVKERVVKERVVKEHVVKERVVNERVAKERVVKGCVVKERVDVDTSRVIVLLIS